MCVFRCVWSLALGVGMCVCVCHVCVYMCVNYCVYTCVYMRVWDHLHVYLCVCCLYSFYPDVSYWCGCPWDVSCILSIVWMYACVFEFLQYVCTFCSWLCVFVCEFLFVYKFACMCQCMLCLCEYVGVWLFLFRFVFVLCVCVCLSFPMISLLSHAITAWPLHW